MALSLSSFSQGGEQTRGPCREPSFMTAISQRNPGLIGVATLNAASTNTCGWVTSLRVLIAMPNRHGLPAGTRNLHPQKQIRMCAACTHTQTVTLDRVFLVSVNIFLKGCQMSISVKCHLLVLCSSTNCCSGTFEKRQNYSSVSLCPALDLFICTCASPSNTSTRCSQSRWHCLPVVVCPSELADVLLFH